MYFILAKGVKKKIIEKKSIQELISKNIEFKLELVGPIPLPLKKKSYTVNRSHHINKKSRDQFRITKYGNFYIVKLTIDSRLSQKIKQKLEEMLDIIIIQIISEILENNSIHISYSFVKSLPKPTID